MIALSTVWNWNRHKTGDALVKEIKSLGIKQLELNFSLKESFFKEIVSAAKKYNMEIVSLHNMCPLPEEEDPFSASPDFYSLASLDEAERQKAVFYTLRTIHSAEEIGAKAVVAHFGRGEKMDLLDNLMNAYKNGLKGTKQYTKMVEEIKTTREKIHLKHVEQLYRSIEEILSYLDKSTVKLGMETRYYINEIPSFHEMGLILEKFPHSSLCYWHDMGHAQVRHNLGFEMNMDYLQEYIGRLGGIHIHDVIGIDDHEYPGKGELDFGNIFHLIKNRDIIKVLEIHKPATPKDIKEAFLFVSGILG